jgi:hypothetical protein
VSHVGSSVVGSSLIAAIWSVGCGVGGRLLVKENQWVVVVVGGEERWQSLVGEEAVREIGRLVYRPSKDLVVVVIEEEGVLVVIHLEGAVGLEALCLVQR